MDSAGAGKPNSIDLERRAAGIRLFVFDVDGVLTDGGLYYGPDGEAMKRFDVKDGHAMVLARLVGLSCAVVTARTSPMVQRRGEELRLAAILQGRRDKAQAVAEILSSLSLEPSACAYMGDDIIDLAAMEAVGLSACPADAVAEVRQRAAFVAQKPGGHGAARELVELCLRASGRWDEALAKSVGQFHLS